MGIYIKGMEMQSRCTICVLCERWRYEGTRNLVCVPADRLIPEDCAERPDWCPMIEVPEPHGRLIDADALMREFAEFVRDSNNSDFADVPTWNDAVSLLGSAPTIEERKWIPCSERLPNHDEYIKNNGLFIVSDGNRSYSEWYDIHDKRRFGEPTMSGFRIDYAVTAWMPLPEPYKGGGE